MKSIQKSFTTQPQSKFGMNVSIPSTNNVEKLKEEIKDNVASNSIDEIDNPDKKDTIDCFTHPTVGVETLSEVNVELSNDKTNATSLKQIKQEINDFPSENVQKQSSVDHVSMFLREINIINKRCADRKAEIESRMDELRKELELLLLTKKTPALLHEYMSNEKVLKEYMKQALVTGAAKLDQSNALPPFSDFISKNEESDDLWDTKSYKNKEIVASLINKIECAKENEEYGKQRKRDLKYDRKQQNDNLLRNLDEDYAEMNLISNEYYNSCNPQYDCKNSEAEGSRFPMFDAYGEYHYNKEFNCESPIFGKIPSKYEMNETCQNKNMPAYEKSHIIEEWDELNKGDDVYNKLPFWKDNNSNWELIGKVQKNDQLLYEDFMNNDPESLFKEEEKNIKHEDNDSDLFANCSQDNNKNKICDIDVEENGESIYDSSESEDSENNINYEYKDFSEDLKEGDYHSSNLSNQNFDANGEYIGADMYGPENVRHPSYYQEHDHMGMYLNPHDQMNRYGQEVFPIDQMMKPHMYQDQIYGGHMNYPFIKTDNEMESYMHMQPRGIDPNSYYKHHKNIKSEMCGPKHHKEKSANKGRKRSKYKMLPTDLKHSAVELAQKKGPKYAATFYSVPLKSLKRWMKVGCERKKGGGRKTKDPIMEKNLYNWYRDKKNRGDIITAKMIKEKAIELTNCSDFIASKGWLDKFKVRFNLEISKESCKDNNNKRRSLGDPIRKRREFDWLENRYYGNDINHYQSYRRSLNKSIKQETSELNNHLFKEESDGIVVGGDNKYLNITHKTQNVKREEWMEKNKGRKNFGNENISSLFPSVLNESQFKNSKRIDKSCSNIISLPLCDVNDSEGDYSYNI